MELEQIKELMANLEKSKIKKIMLKKGDFELQLEKEEEHPPVPLSSPVLAHRPIEAPVEPMFHSDKEKKPYGSEAAHDGKCVTSPMVGTFYVSAAPDQPPFVKVGDRVEENTIVCIIEAMKVMNEVKANISGVVSEVLVENAHPVEFGTKIFRVI